MVNYLWDLVKIFHIKQLKDDEYMAAIAFQISYATPLIRLLIRVISVIDGQLLIEFS